MLKNVAHIDLYKYTPYLGVNTRKTVFRDDGLSQISLLSYRKYSFEKLQESSLDIVIYSYYSWELRTKVLFRPLQSQGFLLHVYEVHLIK